MERDRVTSLGINEAKALLSEVWHSLGNGPEGSLSRKAWLNKAAAQLALAAAAIHHDAAMVSAEAHGFQHSSPVPTAAESQLALASTFAQASQALVREAGK